MQNLLQLTSLSPKEVTHSHYHHQIVFCIRGASNFTLDGCGTGTLSCNQGCIIPSGFQHSFSGSADNSILLLNFSEYSTTNESIDAVRIKRLFAVSEYFDVDTSLQSLVAAIASEVAAFEFQEGSELCFVDALIASLVVRNASKRNQTQGQLHYRINVRDLDRYITSNLHRAITVEELAEASCLSTSQFHRYFLSEVNCTPHQYITTLRTRAAIQLLRRTRLPISVICQKVGFTNQSAFSKAIKKQCNCTPSQIRRSSQHFL